MATDWLTVRQVSWTEYKALGIQVDAVNGADRIKMDNYYGFINKTKSNGILYGEYASNQCNTNPIRLLLREKLGTDLVSYIGELNDHGNYPDVDYPDYKILWKREYP